LKTYLVEKSINFPPYLSKKMQTEIFVINGEKETRINVLFDEFPKTSEEIYDAVADQFPIYNELEIIIAYIPLEKYKKFETSFRTNGLIIIEGKKRFLKN